MRYLRLISWGLLSCPIAITALENSPKREFSLDSSKSGISIAELSRRANNRFQRLDNNSDKVVSFDEFVNQKDSLKNRRKSLKKEEPKVGQIRPERDRGLKNTLNTRQQRNKHSKELFKILDKDLSLIHI